MVKKLISILVILIAIIFPLLSSCTNQTTTQIHDTTPILSTTPITLTSTSISISTSSIQTTSEVGGTLVNIADQGKLLLNGQIFDFTRIGKWGDEVINFEGITFTPVIPKTTVTAPIVYWVTIGFKDGETEDLQYILYLSNIQNDGNLSINTTKHNNPTAGIMLGYQNGSPMMYLLVSE